MPDDTPQHPNAWDLVIKDWKACRLDDDPPTVLRHLKERAEHGWTIPPFDGTDQLYHAYVKLLESAPHFRAAACEAAAAEDGDATHLLRLYTHILNLVGDLQTLLEAREESCES